MRKKTRSSLFALIFILANLSDLAAQEIPETSAAEPIVIRPEDSGGPAYSLAVDAAAGFVFAGPNLDPQNASSSLSYLSTISMLHRVEAPGWGLALVHDMDLSGVGYGKPFAPSFLMYEAYARADAKDWGQAFIGQKRFATGPGSTFSPGDAINPRTGFWDQKTGFKGFAATASLGSDFALRAAVSLDGNLAARSADPALALASFGAEWQTGNFQAAAAWSYRKDTVNLPSLGCSLDVFGLLLQAEGAVDLAEGIDSPAYMATTGASMTWSSRDLSLTTSVDYEYGGIEGLLVNTHYLLPSISFTWTDHINLYARSLVELEGSSANLSAGLIWYVVENIELECAGSFGLGPENGEFAALSIPVVPGSDPVRSRVALVARAHF